MLKQKNKSSAWEKLETDLESAVTKTLFEEYGVLGCKLTMIRTSGWPDHIYLGPKQKIVFVEFKRGEAEPKPRQGLIHKLLIAFGFTVLIFNNKDKAVRGILKALNMLPRGLH